MNSVSQLSAGRAERRASRQGPAGIPSQRGYTLLEVLIAFSLLAVGLSFLLSVLSSGIKSIGRASDSTRASLYAESLMDSLGADRRLQVGRLQGSFENGRYRWVLDIAPYTTPPPVPVAGGPQPAVQQQAVLAENVMFRVQLQMQWNGGGSGNTLKLDTLRAYNAPQDASE